MSLSHISPSFSLLDMYRSFQFQVLRSNKEFCRGPKKEIKLFQWVYIIFKNHLTKRLIIRNQACSTNYKDPWSQGRGQPEKAGLWCEPLYSHFLHSTFPVSPLCPSFLRLNGIFIDYSKSIKWKKSLLLVGQVISSHIFFKKYLFICPNY